MRLLFLIAIVICGFFNCLGQEEPTVIRQVTYINLQDSANQPFFKSGMEISKILIEACYNGDLDAYYIDYKDNSKIIELSPEEVANALTAESDGEVNPKLFNAWNDDKRYSKGDVVLFENMLYMATKNVRGRNPKRNKRWKLVDSGIGQIPYNSLYLMGIDETVLTHSGNIKRLYNYINFYLHPLQTGDDIEYLVSFEFDDVRKYLNKNDQFMWYRNNHGSWWSGSVFSDPGLNYLHHTDFLNNLLLVSKNTSFKPFLLDDAGYRVEIPIENLSSLEENEYYFSFVEDGVINGENIDYIEVLNNDGMLIALFDFSEYKAAVSKMFQIQFTPIICTFDIALIQRYFQTSSLFNPMEIGKNGVFLYDESTIDPLSQSFTFGTETDFTPVEISGPFENEKITRLIPGIPGTETIKTGFMDELVQAIINDEIDAYESFKFEKALSLNSLKQIWQDANKNAVNNSQPMELLFDHYQNVQFDKFGQNKKYDSEGLAVIIPYWANPAGFDQPLAYFTWKDINKLFRDQDKYPNGKAFLNALEKDELQTIYLYNTYIRTK
ncbi:hypothetical protein OO013_12230 [Mangrovivirga sp. M17]|uniref:Uncharacterized protein n=1 Tax=Mangrovivirga halotolerans TaxID=2993936 RepID=A0ABT3RS86_9BACT|nr:hypothetical protein [Mangrovivirga halotolerans]MCX2744641.1 hypothetical protein [Mangrovivirga halotolerans]